MCQLCTPAVGMGEPLLSVLCFCSPLPISQKQRLLGGSKELFCMVRGWRRMSRWRLGSGSVIWLSLWLWCNLGSSSLLGSDIHNFLSWRYFLCGLLCLNCCQVLYGHRNNYSTTYVSLLSWFSMDTCSSVAIYLLTILIGRETKSSSRLKHPPRKSTAFPSKSVTKKSKVLSCLPPTSI